MTKKIYKTAMGKTVDLGSLLLQNETVRAVGNMNVNARGDLLDSNNRVIDQKSRQVQRQYRRQTNVSNIPVATSTRTAKEKQFINTVNSDVLEPALGNEFTESPENIVVAPGVVNSEIDATVEPQGGLAAAIARAKTVKQELEKTAKQQAQSQPLKRI
jgi:hypothetical protein